jgi:two-component system OmpR family sensor kinase
VPLHAGAPHAHPTIDPFQDGPCPGGAVVNPARVRDRIRGLRVPSPRAAAEDLPEPQEIPVPGPVAAAAGARGSWWRRVRWSLRARLLAAVLALMAAVCLTVGVLSVLQMRSYLQGRLDSDVGDAAGRTLRSLNAPPGQNTILFGPGQEPGTVIATVANGQVTGAVVLSRGGDSGQVQGGRGTVAALATVPADQHIHTRDLGAGLGSYRLLAVRLNNGTVAVTGLPTTGVDATVFRLSVVIVALTLGGLLLTVLAGAAIIRLALRPLRRVAATAQQVAALPLHEGEVALAVRVPDEHTDPRTEVGQVGAALNSMLGHVAQALTLRQESETRVRRFVADASHELRTPLAAIRGYTELARRNPQPVPGEVSHAMERVHSQAVRMSGLVDDLLLLASLDSGRPMQAEPVDLTGVLIGAVFDAHAAGPGHDWKLDLPEPDPTVTVSGEEARLTQVVVNLLANARTHTPAGTTVTARLRRTGSEAVLTVTDNGPGIPADLQPEVFERFARGDASRSRAAGSTGLGLSIVSAIVTAHHGRIGLDSRPGRTTFTVHLPLAST